MYDIKHLDSTVYSRNVNIFNFQNLDSRSSLLNNTKTDKNQLEQNISIDKIIFEEKVIGSSEEEWGAEKAGLQLSPRKKTYCKVIDVILISVYE